MKTISVIALLSAIRLCWPFYKNLDEQESKPVTRKLDEWIFFRHKGLHTIHYAYNAVTDDFIRVENHAINFGIKISKAAQTGKDEFVRAFVRENQVNTMRQHKSFDKCSEEEFIHVLNSMMIEYGEILNPLLTKYFK